MSTTKPGVVITILCKKSPDFTFDRDYYLNTHGPLVKKLWQPHGLLDAYYAIPVSPESEFEYVVTLNFKDLEGWEKASTNAEEMGQIRGDIKNFTNAKPTFVVSKVAATLA